MTPEELARLEDDLDSWSRSDQAKILAEIRRLRRSIDGLRTMREVCSLDIEEGAIDTANERLFEAVDGLLAKVPRLVDWIRPR